MREAIIAGPRSSGRGLQVWLPNGVTPTEVPCPRCKGQGSEDGKTACGVCHGAAKVKSEFLDRAVIDRCRVCVEFVLYRGESRGRMEKHVIECVERNRDRLLAERRRAHPEIMKPWDPEYSSWLKVNKDAIMRGDVKA